MDQIVAAIQHQGEVYIFTKFGHVWKMVLDPDIGPYFSRVANLPLS